MSRIKDFFQRTVRALKPVSLGGGKPKVLYDISNTAGAPGSIGRRIVRQRVLPAMHVQVGTRNGLPVMKTVQVHRFLHATKGWREYHNGMPFANAPAFRGLPRNPSAFGQGAPCKRQTTGHHGREQKERETSRARLARNEKGGVK
jgi:hypothetical protein